MSRFVLTFCLLCSAATPVCAQEIRQTVRQLRADNLETRMLAFYRLLEAGEKSGARGSIVGQRAEIARELRSLGMREEATLLDAAKTFTPEQMRYFTQLLAFNARLAGQPTAAAAVRALPPAARQESQIVLSGLLRLLTDTTLLKSIR